MYARGVLEDALKTSKNVGKKKKTAIIFTMAHRGHAVFCLVCFCFVNRTIKSNYRVINDKLSRDK